MSASGLDTRGIVRVLALAGVREGREGAARGPFTVGDADAAAGATRIFSLHSWRRMAGNATIGSNAAGGKNVV